MILVLSRLLIAALVCATARYAYADDVPLRRRADLGAAIAAPEGGEPARIVRFRPESVLEKAGLRIGDQIVAVDARPLTDATVFGATLRRLRGGDVVRIDARRGNEFLGVDIRSRPNLYDATRHGAWPAAGGGVHPLAIVRRSRSSLWTTHRRLGQDAQCGHARCSSTVCAHRKTRSR